MQKLSLRISNVEKKTSFLFARATKQIPTFMHSTFEYDTSKGNTSGITVKSLKLPLNVLPARYKTY